LKPTLRSEKSWRGKVHSTAREIALAFGVPPMFLGIPGDNTYSNYAEANRALGHWLGESFGAGKCTGRARSRPFMTSLIRTFSERGDLAHLALFLWASASSALLVLTLRELFKATARFDAFVRELARFNRRVKK
jgi:hypothetical protein